MLPLVPHHEDYTVGLELSSLVGATRGFSVVISHVIDLYSVRPKEDVQSSQILSVISSVVGLPNHV